MFKTMITPRIGDTDALRHINNNALPIWFETARNPVFKIFNPTLELTYKKWNLIMVHCDFNYLKQIYFGYDVEIRTYVTKIGKTSLTLTHEAWQNGKLRANGTCTMVYFDFIKQSSVVIAEDIREKLKEHYITKEDLENSNKKEMKENKNNKESVDYIESDLYSHIKR